MDDLTVVRRGQVYTVRGLTRRVEDRKFLRRRMRRAGYRIVVGTVTLLFGLAIWGAEVAAGPAPAPDGICGNCTPGQEP